MFNQPQPMTPAGPAIVQVRTLPNGAAVDCHICRETRNFLTEFDAHSYAANHAMGHQALPSAPAPIAAPQQFPRYAKTTINHTPHIVLDLITFGMWIPVHITLAILGGRKTRFR